MRGLVQDFRHALRLYRRTPGESLVAVVVLAIGVAFVAAFVSLYVDLVLKRHPGFEGAARLVTYGRNDGGSRLPLDFIDRLAEESSTLEAAAGLASRNFHAGEDDAAVVGEVVTRGFFGGLKPRLALGRGFGPAEHQLGGAPAVVIAHAYWQQVLGGRPDVLGTTLSIRAAPAGRANPDEQESANERTDFRIIGVAAPGLAGITSVQQQDARAAFWLPVEHYLPMLARVSQGLLRDEAFLRSNGISLLGVGRLAEGVSATAAAAELNARYFDNTELAGNAAARFGVLDGIVLDAGVQRSAQRQLQLFLTASVLLALVAAANVSLFLLARAPTRRRELAIRLAVGARTGRLARQLVSEAALIVVAAAMLGLVLSVWLAGFLRGLEFLRRAQWREVTLLDWRVLAIVGLLLVTLVLLVSLAPILGLRKQGIAMSSSQLSSRASIAQRVAGTAQITIAAALAGPAIAFSWYLGVLMFGHPGYETRDLHAVRYSINSDGYHAAGEAGFESFYVDQSRRRELIGSLPGVTHVSLASAVPGMRGGLQTVYLQNPADTGKQLDMPLITIDDAYVSLLGLTLVHGRTPSSGESRAMLVNQALAQRLWGRDDVVGEVLGSGPQTSQVVGVLGDLPYGHPAADTEPRAFATWTQQFMGSGVALIRSTAASAELRRQLQGLVDAGALELVITDVSPLTALRSSVLAADRARGFLTIGAAVLVVLTAAFGFYGLQRYLVAAGRREYAIRASLGAGPRSLGRLVLWRGMLLGLPGLALGLPLAFIVVAWLRDDYVSRTVSPPLVTLAVCFMLVLLLVAATRGPARQARRTHPASLLRED